MIESIRWWRWWRLVLCASSTTVVTIKCWQWAFLQTTDTEDLCRSECWWTSNGRFGLDKVQFHNLHWSHHVFLNPTTSNPQRRPHIPKHAETFRSLLLVCLNMQCQHSVLRTGSSSLIVDQLCAVATVTGRRLSPLRSHHTRLRFKVTLLSWKTHRCSTLFSWSFLTSLPHPLLLLASQPFSSPRFVSQAGLTGSEHNVPPHERDNIDRKWQAQHPPQMDRKLTALFSLAD